MNSCPHALPEHNFTAQCVIDATDDVFQYRNVTLKISRKGTKKSAYNRILYCDNSTCSPPGNPAISVSLPTASMGDLDLVDCLL